jgi:hypothetical protein
MRGRNARLGARHTRQGRPPTRRRPLPSAQYSVESGAVSTGAAWAGTGAFTGTAANPPRCRTRRRTASSPLRGTAAFLLMLPLCGPRCTQSTQAKPARHPSRQQPNSRTRRSRRHPGGPGWWRRRESRGALRRPRQRQRLPAQFASVLCEDCGSHDSCNEHRAVYCVGGNGGTPGLPQSLEPQLEPK